MNEFKKTNELFLKHSSNAKEQGPPSTVMTLNLGHITPLLLGILVDSVELETDNSIWHRGAALGKAASGRLVQSLE